MKRKKAEEEEREGGGRGRSLVFVGNAVQMNNSRRGGGHKTPGDKKN